MNTQAPYIEFIDQTHSRVSLEHFTNVLNIGLHKHAYYEFFVVERGICKHIYNNTETLLVPGDAAIIPPHHPHGYELNGAFSMYICQFFPSALNFDILQMLLTDAKLFPTLSKIDLSDLSGSKDNYAFSDRETIYGQKFSPYALNSTKQGIIHFTPPEFSFVLSLFRQGMDTGTFPADYISTFQKRIIETIMCCCAKSSYNQNQEYLLCSHAQQRTIGRILSFIENNLDSQFDFSEIADRYSLSANYLRRLFRQTTGLSPVAYVNRLRIVKAYEYMQNEDISVQKAAAMVGIYDQNYFSRLFKKLIGCSPTKALNNTHV